MCESPENNAKPRPPGALAGVRVLDLTRVLAGPLCTMLLGDMGADIVKVERPESGDDTRAWGPPFVGSESAYYLGANRNKRSVTLNLGVQEGRDLLRRLVPLFDVVVDNYRPGQLEKWGFDEAWFDAQAPAAVRCSITGYGSTGPEARRGGYDFILQAESGLMAVTGEADGEPMKVGVAVVDIATGLLAGIAILGGLHARSETGRGQRVEVSLFDSSLMLMANVAAAAIATGEPSARYGNSHPSIVPYRSFETADGELALAVGNDDQFARLAGVVGRPDWLEDPRLVTNRARVEHRQLADGVVQEALRARSREEWLPLLEQAGIPAGRVDDVRDALASAHAAAREAVATVAHPELGELRIPGTPLRFGKTPASVSRHPPLLGEHTSEVLGELLGLDEEAVDGLRRRGVV